jgi:hypothetical protein
MSVQRGSTKLTVALLALALVAAAGAGWWRFARNTAEQCQACRREVHIPSRTVGYLDGKRAVFCCPVCALTETKQSGKQVRITTLTDFDTGASLDPAKAVLVRDSEVNPCKDSKGHMSHDKQPLHVHFDRCAPSVLAFATRESALAFARRHGGQLTRFADLAPHHH